MLQPSETRRKWPTPVTEMTLGELADFQSIAAHHITFSLTLACPLRCAHCIVGASPDLKHTTMPIEIAEAYAAQMPSLAAHGIRSLSFTGGEPFLARTQIKTLTNAAAAVGIASGVVTAGHWAKDRSLADQLVADFPSIRNWDISIDRYHLDWMALDTAVNAIEAARDAGRVVTIRYTYEDPPTPVDDSIWRAVQNIKDVKIASQRVRAEGRGKDLSHAVSRRYAPWTKPCLTQGLVVRYDGSVAPCCLNLVETREHAFQFPDARKGRLTELHDAFMAHPLLQLIRVIGFSELWRWLEEADLVNELGPDLPDDTCDLCSFLMRRPAISSYLAERAARPEVEVRVALLASRVLGEHTMARRLRDRWKASPQLRPEGFDLLDDYLSAIDGRTT